MSNIQPLRFHRPGMLNYLKAVDEPFDVVVIGGGATGLYTALDSTLRGYRTVLFERGDFASGTSSRSTKLVHGGVRYLKQGRIGLVRESLAERHRLMQNAPHLVHALPILVPAYSRWQQVKYTAGLLGYGAIARGHGFSGTRTVGAGSATEFVPALNTNHLRGGVIFMDGQMDDARLAIAIARTAADYGAAVVNYVDVKSLVTSRGRVVGVEAEDRINGGSLRIRAHVVINATGVFTDETRSMDESNGPGLMQWSRGTHIVLAGSLLGGQHGLLIPETSDGRVIYALPWLGGSLVGTTDVAVDSPDADPSAPQEDVDFLLGEVEKFLPGAGSLPVLAAFTGIRPLVKETPDVDTAQLARSHRIVVSDSRLVTITGGKWTTARLMAEQTVTRAAEVGGLARGRSATDRLRLRGYDRMHDTPEPLASPVADPDLLYGTDREEIRKLEKRWPELKAPLSSALPYRLSHAVYAAREEMAMTLEDVLARRTRSLFLDATAASEAAGRVARLVESRGDLKDGWAAEEMTKLPHAVRQFVAAG